MKVRSTVKAGPRIVIMPQRIVAQCVFRQLDSNCSRKEEAMKIRSTVKAGPEVHVMPQHKLLSEQIGTLVAESNSSLQNVFLLSWIRKIAAERRTP